MSFPSDQIREWCKWLWKLLDALGPHVAGRVDGLCQCEVGHMVSFVPLGHRPQFVSGLFWSVWIDQVMWYVLVEGGVRGCYSDRNFYEAFIRRYPFPKLYFHAGDGHASPAWLLAPERSYPGPGRELLLEDKREFWGEVAAWLESVERSDIRDAAVFAFREDLDLRFPPDLHYLFSEG